MGQRANNSIKALLRFLAENGVVVFHRETDNSLECLIEKEFVVIKPHHSTKGRLVYEVYIDGNLALSANNINEVKRFLAMRYKFPLRTVSLKGKDAFEKVTATVRLPKFIDVLLGKMVRAGYFSSKSEAIRSAVIFLAMNLGMLKEEGD